MGSSQEGSGKTKGLAKGWTRVLVHKACFIEYLLGESCSVPQSCLTLGDPMDCHTPGCLLLSPGVCSNSCSLSWWYHPTISSSVISFSSCLQSFPASGSFPVSWLFTSGGTSTGASASASVLPRNIQGWFTGAGITNWLVWCPCCPRTLKSPLQHPSSQASILQCSVFFIVQLSHLYMTTGKTVTLTIWTFVGKVTSLLFNMLSRSVITFLPRSKHLLISWLQSPSTVIL